MKHQKPKMKFSQGLQFKPQSYNRAIVIQFVLLSTLSRFARLVYRQSRYQRDHGGKPKAILTYKIISSLRVLRTITVYCTNLTHRELKKLTIGELDTVIDRLVQHYAPDYARSSEYRAIAGGSR